MNSYRFSASARLGIWSHTKGDPESFISNLDPILYSNSHSVLESEEIDFIPTNNSLISSLMAILDKITIRGNPTLIDHFYEESCLNNLIKKKFMPSFQEDPDSMKILEPKDPISLPFAQADILKAVKDLFSLPLSKNVDFSISDSITNSHLINSAISPEEHLFEDQFKSVFPKSFHHCLHRQVLIGDLGLIQDPALSTGRVDFVFHVGDIKWIFEIDGVQHEQISQQDLDIARDELNARNGWKTYRFSASKVRSGVLPELNILFLEFEKDTFYLSKKSSINDIQSISSLHGFVYESVLIPHLVHNTVRGLIQLYVNDILDPFREQKILLLEEDICVFEIALKLFARLWSSIHTLSPSSPPVPSLKIDKLSDILPDHKSFGPISIQKVNAPQGPYDLIISHSAILSSGQIGAQEKKLFPKRPTNLVAFRKAIGCRADQKLSWTNPISYDLSDVEQAAQLQSKDSSLPFPVRNIRALQFLLRYIFRMRDFKDGQLHVISRLLQQKDTIVLLPTGGGKSLTYQFSGLLLPGLCLVIDPLISLMDDQVENLRSLGITMVDCISSVQTQEEKSIIQEKLISGSYAFIFISPERLQSSTFRTSLNTVSSNFQISLAVIDEAHCVSEWGHDFRPSYLHLPYNIRSVCSNGSKNKITLVGLTGTASFAVLTDVQIEMGIEDENAIITPKSFDREELSFEVIKTPVSNKPSVLRTVKNSLPMKLRSNPQTFYLPKGKDTNSGLIFCPHSSGSLGVIEVAKHLNHSFVYSGKTPRGFSSAKTFSDYKKNIQSDFKKNQIQEIVATKSFGMGFDKPNIRYTIHYAAPNSVEAFYQEAGRAGRNGKKGYANCSIIYSDDNWSSALKIFDEQNPSKARSLLDSISFENRGDVLHQLYFLLNSYPGSVSEFNSAKKFWRSTLSSAVQLLSFDSTNNVEISFTNGNRGEIEKALVRFIVLGCVLDYTVDYSPNKITATVRKITPEQVKQNLYNYIRHYKFSGHAEEIASKVVVSSFDLSVESALELLTDFIYSEIVSKRKQAIRTMGELCRSFDPNDVKAGEDFREKILSYLQESEFTEALKTWIKRDFSAIGIDRINNVLSRISTLEEVKRLVGTTRRMLDNDPNNLALRCLSVFARIQNPSESDSSIIDETSTFAALTNRAKISVDEKLDIFSFLFPFVHNHRPSLFDKLSSLIFSITGDLSISRLFLTYDFEFSDLSRRAAVKLLLSSAENSLKNNSFFTNLPLEVSHGL